MKMFFLTGMPRAGNTLFSVILNSNKNIKVSANSILPDIIYYLNNLKVSSEIYNNFPDEKSLNNIVNNIFNNYYSHWNSKYIIDRGPWGTKENLKLLKNIVKEPKFIILYRPVLECLASFIRLEKPFDIERRCVQLMDSTSEGNIIYKYYSSINHIVKTKEKHIFINYSDLVSNPTNVLKSLSKFIGTKILLPNKIKQFELNGLRYDDSIYPFSLHKVRTNGIRKQKYLVKEILPESIIKRYEKF